jgi:hypothetical protein
MSRPSKNDMKLPPAMPRMARSSQSYLGVGPTVEARRCRLRRADHLDILALRLIEQWAVLHRADLEGNWARMKAGQTLERIAPLE